MANTAIEKKNSAGALATISLRSDSGKGSEEIKSDDVSTPILKILHQLSPECNQSNAKYVEGSKPGMIYAKGLGTLIDGDKGVDILIAHVQTRYPEWQEMGDTAAPPVATHMSVPSDAVEERNGKWRLSNGNYLEKTAYFYVVVLGEEPRPAVITMRSSNLTPAREINQMIKNLRFQDEQGKYNPAAYAAVYTLKTAGKIAGSKSWHVYKPSFKRALDVSVETDTQLYLMAQEFQKSVSKGQAKPKYEEKSAKPTEEII
jgi:hypothetical protein|tara:strand:- start:284 stop:1060 length:777 start_codon:yes stop_codon:yes gene_type:complete